MDKASFFILNIVLNSLLAFFTASLFIEGIIFLFRIRLGRMTALLRMVPILKLPLDLCLYDFTRWSFEQGINPLLCEKGTRTLSALIVWPGSPIEWIFLRIHAVIHFTIPGEMTFTIADMIGYVIKPRHLNFFSIVFILLTIGLFIKRLATYYYSIKPLNTLFEESIPLYRKLHNARLKTSIKKEKFQVFISKALSGSPFVAGLFSPIIYIPSQIEPHLSRNEYEAVLAHEIEHFRYKDNLVRFFLDLIESLFWWVPTKWLQRRIEEGQEIGCDRKCTKYGILPTDLASAIGKSAKYARHNTDQIFANLLSKHGVLKRIKILLLPASLRFKKTFFIYSCLVTLIAFSAILLGRFWIF